MSADQIDDLMFLRAVLAAVAFHGMATDPLGRTDAYKTLAAKSVEVADIQLAALVKDKQP